MMLGIRVAWERKLWEELLSDGILLPGSRIVVYLGTSRP